MPKRKPARNTDSSLESSDESNAGTSPSPSERSHIRRKTVRWEGRTATTGDEMASDDQSEDEEESQIEEKTCLATLCSHGSVGCAYYDPLKRILCILEDTRETQHFDLTRMLLEQVSADIILSSSKSDDDFIDALNEHMEGAGGTFQIRPFKEFVASKGRERLLSISRLRELCSDDRDLPPSSDDGSHSHRSRPTNAYDFMQSRREVSGDPAVRQWNASIRISNFISSEAAPLCMASIGALLDHLAREKALSDFDEGGIEGLDIRDIEIFALDQVMQINADALLSLQVFENESHASVHSDKTKEGLSLFGILNNTKTTLGRALLRTWLLRPSLSLSTIRSRHDAVACFTKPENITTANTLHSHLKGIKNMPRTMSLMKDGKAKLTDWQGLVKFTFHATMLRDSLSELYQGGNVAIVQKLLEVLDVTVFKEIGMKINDIIDWEESTCNDRICVRPHIDEDLDNRKHVYHGIDTVLSNVAEQLSLTVPETFAKSLNVVYFPQLGYLICVPMLDEWRTETGIEPLDGWTFQFSSDAHVYFKSQEMQDMDTHIGDLHSTIVDRELEIIQELLEEVLASTEAIEASCDVCAELDCLLSFAQASRIYDYRCPKMVDDNIIELIQARHPLQERVLDTFVPNDARLIGGAGIGADPDRPDDAQWNSVLLCTGANACGKSVYLKQIAVIQIMAQVGCFVPAESATLGIVDKIFTRVSTRESVSKAQSAFMIDLAQVSLALRNCTPRSLILLDEFGKGTLSTGSYDSIFDFARFPSYQFLFLFASITLTPKGFLNCPCYLVFELTIASRLEAHSLTLTNPLKTDGAGLFCGVLRHLLNRGSKCPKVLVATHFHDVFNEDLFDPESIPVSFRHMQVMFTSSTGAIVEPGTPSISASSRGASPLVSTIEDVSGVTTNKTVGPAEKITYLYRVAEGLSLDSHAAKCAEIFGIPLRIVERAQHVSQLLSSHQLGRLLDEGMTDAERVDLEEAEAVCRRFLAWDLKEEGEDICEGEVKKKLAVVLGRQLDDVEDGLNN
ncbi:hypothetical protein BDN70DRAFT_863087 [Pholiota conissans]|uniref:DNA mismatch repair proteins mutS family domain-containing protein n=1 Tax=Pholiota conissans TaxID=109636 RepID=A0A9P5YXU0_9AGAR|nr:hypothetical protein BDN70DRAFT_863087 [Pholiota conissans]